MIAAGESEEGIITTSSPYLSHSRVSRYLLCPEQYRLYYVENLRPKVQSAALVFGQVVHMALSFLFRHGEDPVKVFTEAWAPAQNLTLDYGKRDSWEKLNQAGKTLLEKFVREELPRITNVRSSEKRFELEISTLEIPFIGVIDLVADLDGRSSVIDFKTAGSAYEDHEADLSDQLTAYKLAEPEVEQGAFCVLLKLKEPRIEWLKTARTGENLVEYLVKAEYVAREIASGRFYKRSGKWCSWCDFLPVCLGDEKKAAETLVRV